MFPIRVFCRWWKIKWQEKINRIKLKRGLTYYIFCKGGSRITFFIWSIFSLFQVPLSGQQMIHGKVTEKNSTMPIAGATVILKGVASRTMTGADGSFSIMVNKEGDTLIFQSVGYITREYVINGTGPLVLALKLSCNIDYFDNQRISIGLQSGLRHTALGGYITVTLPYFLTKGTAWAGVQYQSGAHASVVRLEAGYDHIISECDFRMDLIGGYTKVNLPDKVNAGITYTGTQMHFSRLFPFARYLRLYAGAGQMQFYERTASKWRKYVGPSIGFGTSFFRKNSVEINGQVLLIKHHPEFQVQAEWLYRRMRFFSSYYQLNSFKELTVGAGWYFYYRAKKN